MAVYPFCLAALLLYSPADHHNRPMSKVQKKYSRGISLMVFFVLAGISLVVKPLYSYIICFSVVAECIMILPVTYRISGNGHGDQYFSQKEISNNTGLN